MAKEVESEGQTVPKADDPWQSAGGDPWGNAKPSAHEGVTVSDSPVSEDAETEDKGQTVTGDTGARSSQDSTEDAKTDQDKKKDVKEETEVTDQTIHAPVTPGPQPRMLWRTPWESSWWSSPLQNWYDGGQSAQGGWWSQPAQGRWHWASDSQRSWTTPSWWSSGTWEGEKEKVAKVVMKDTGVATDAQPQVAKVTTKETGVATDAQAKTDQGGQTEGRGSETGSERNRDYGAPPEFKGLDNLETYKRAVGRWKDRTGFKPQEQAGTIMTLFRWNWQNISTNFRKKSLPARQESARC